MSDMPHAHWTHDEDLLARFVLGHLDPEQTSVLEQHLRECSECREAVQAESLIAAGVKRAGRQEMKQRLSTMIARKDLGTFKWSRVAGVAAAILLLVTAGVIGLLFVPDGSQHVAQRDERDTLAPKATLPNEQQSVPQTATEAPPEDFVDAFPVPGRRGERKSVAATESVGGRPNDVAPLPADRATPRLALALSADDIWLDGSEIPDAPPSRDVVFPMKGLREDRPGIEARREKGIMAMSQGARERSVQGDSLSVTVKQLPLASMPERLRDAEFATQLIRTFVKKTSTGLHVTVFSDSLQSEEQIGRPEGRVVGPDSLVIQIGGRRIGYKFPAGWIKKVLPRQASGKK